MVEMEVERQEALEPQPEELQQVLITVKRWFDQDREAKEFYVREMDENDKLYEGHHWDLIGPDGNPLRSKRQQAMRPNAVENVTFSLVAGAVSEFSDPVEIVDFPVEPGDDEVARLMTDLKQYILDKNDYDVQRMAWNWNFFWHGTGIWEVSWDPTWKGGRGPNRWVGEVRLINRHPRTVFPDARCGDNVQNGRRIHVVSYVPIEYVRENFPEWGYMVRESTVDEAIAGRAGSAAKQIGVVALVTTWYIGEPLLPTKEDAENKGREGIGLHKIFWADLDNPVFLDHENDLYFAESEMPRFPFIFRQRYPRKDPSVWGHGEPYFLKNPQIIHNKTVEILIEGHVHSALGQGFYEPQALDEKQMKALKTQGTLPGMWFAVNDINRVKRIYGQSMPSSLLQEAQRLPRMMEQIMGRFDISQGKTPGSVTAFRALDLIAQRAQVRLKAVDLAIRSAYKEIGEWMNRLIWNYYTGRRAYRIVGENEHGLYLKKQGVFSIDDYRKVYDFVTGEVVPYTVFQPLEGMVEGTDYEVYNPDLDVRVRTTQQMPSDRLFYMELAKEMYLMKLLDPQTMFEVMRDGRFPHWDRMKDRILAYLQQQTGQVQHPAAGARDMGERSVLRLNQRPEIEAVLRQLTDEQLDALSQMTPEEQEEFFARLIETPPQ